MENGRFVAAGEADASEVVDAAGCYVIPVWSICISTAARERISATASSEGLHDMAAYEASRGVTAMCPCDYDAVEEILTEAARAAAAFEPAEHRSRSVGINMEGPFISPSKVGAQNPTTCAIPRRGVPSSAEGGGGLFKIVDIAPEASAVSSSNSFPDEVRISLRTPAPTTTPRRMPSSSARGT